MSVAAQSVIEKDLDISLFKSFKNQLFMVS